MSNPFASLCRLHRFCVNHLVYPLVLSALLAGALLLGRFYLTRRWDFRFLVWDSFLAWVPYLSALTIAILHQRYPRRVWLIVIPSFVWLLFLPNAPYLLTDWWHLHERKPVPLWYDVGMLASFAWMGLFLGVASLRTMHSIVEKILGRVIGWLFALGAIGASGFGIYLGRFLDWNSWDVFFEPHNILADILIRLAHPIRHSQTYGVTMLFAGLMLVTYLMLKSAEQRKVEQIES
ncbi:MAG: DUF1361 domain-containing protein [Chloroflexi bacterium]|nr:DUF1361 domain-containing protein [Chloroflexota bacterium]